MKIIIPRMETTYFHKAYDGGCKFMQSLSEELIKRGHTVEIVTTRLRDNPNLKEAYYRGVKHVFILPFYSGKRLIPLNMFYKMLFSYHLNKYLQTQDFDILHSSEAFAYFYLHNKVKKKVVFQSWALEPWYGDECESQRGLKKLYVNLFLKKPWGFCIKHSDCVTADKPFQIPLMLKIGIDRHKIEFIPNGIPFKKIQELKKKFKNRRSELGFKKMDVVLLSVSQLVEDKGIEDILQAFVLTKKEIKNLKLIIIGKGILEERVHSFIKENNFEKDIVHLKNIPEEILFDYHFSSDIFINAVRTNNMMISIQEGMATGLPLISAAQPFLVKDKVNGYIVGIKNPKGIAKGIVKICRDGNAKKMGKESIKLASEYDWGNIAESAIKVYEKLIKKSF